MSIERCRKIKACFFIAILAVAEAREVQQNVLLNTIPSLQAFTAAKEAVPREQAKQVARQMDLMFDSGFQQQANRIVKEMEVLTADSDSKMQENSKSVEEHLQAMMANSKLHTRLKAVVADPHLKEQIKHVVEQIDVVMADRDYKEKARLFAKQLQTTMADPELKRMSKLAARSMEAMVVHPTSAEQRVLEKQLEAMKAHPKLRKSADVMAEEVLAMMAHPKLQEQAKLIAKRMEAMMTIPKLVAEPRGGRHRRVEELAGNVADKLFDRTLKASGSPASLPQGKLRGSRLRGNVVRPVVAIERISRRSEGRGPFARRTKKFQGVIPFTRQETQSIALDHLRGVARGVRDAQVSVMETFDKEYEYPPWLTIFLMEWIAPFIIYAVIIFAGRLAVEPGDHELGILWISTVVFTMASINYKARGEMTKEWVSSAIMSHFLSCWLPLQVPVLADQLLLPQDPIKYCRVQSFIPIASQEKILDWSKFFSTTNCGRSVNL